MSDDAFALSPLASRSPLSDADYEVIHAAVMETARGRWFLSEYARRNRNADTQLLLRAIEQIEETVRRERMDPSSDRIRFDLHEMAKAIIRTKEEIAAIRPEPGGGDRISEAAVELNAIVRATETATTRVLQAAEQVQELAWTLRKAGVDARICDQLDAHATDIYIACEFQDITGQRTQKVVEVLRFLEERINAMMRIWSGENPPPYDIDKATRQPAAAMDQADVDVVMAPPGPATASAPPVEPTSSSAYASIPGEFAEALNRGEPPNGVAATDDAEMPVGPSAGQNAAAIATTAAEAAVPGPHPSLPQDLSSQDEHPVAAPASPEIAADLPATVTDEWISQASWAAMAQAWAQPDPVSATEPPSVIAAVESAEAGVPEPEVVGAAGSAETAAAVGVAAAEFARDEPASPVKLEATASADEPASLAPEPAAVADEGLPPEEVAQAEAFSADGPALQQPAPNVDAAATTAIDALAKVQESRVDWAVDLIVDAAAEPGGVATSDISSEPDADGASAAPEPGAVAHGGGAHDAGGPPFAPAVPVDMPAAHVGSHAGQPSAAAVAFEPEPAGQAPSPAGNAHGISVGAVDAASAEFFNAELWAAEIGAEELPSESDADLLEPIAMNRFDAPPPRRPDEDASPPVAAAQADTVMRSATALPDIGPSPPAEAASVPPTETLPAGMPHLFDQPGPATDSVRITAGADTGEAWVPGTAGEDREAVPAAPTLAAQSSVPVVATAVPLTVVGADDWQGAGTAEDDELTALLFEPARPAARESQLMLVASACAPPSAPGAGAMQGLPGGILRASEGDAVNGGTHRPDQVPAATAAPFPRPQASGRTLRSDPLAPLAAMSNEERIALFS